MDDDFMFTFPAYILASNFNVDPETGGVVLDAELRFTAPRDATGRSSVAIFTDYALAEAHQEGSSVSVQILELATPEALRDFLVIAAPFFEAVILDVNRKTKMGHLIEIRPLIEALNRLVG